MRKRPNPDSEPNIKRIDTKSGASKQTHGFQVHFLRGDQSVTRMFSDSVYGGKEGARRAARKFKRTAMSDIAPSARGFALSNAAAKKSDARKTSSKKNS